MLSGFFNTHFGMKSSNPLGRTDKEKGAEIRELKGPLSKTSPDNFWRKFDIDTFLKETAQISAAISKEEEKKDAG